MLRTAAKRTAVQAAKKKRTSRATGRKDHGPEAWNKLLPHLPQGGRRREAGRWQHVRSPAHLSYHMFIGQLPFWMPIKCPCLPIKNHHFCQWNHVKLPYLPIFTWDPHEESPVLPCSHSLNWEARGDVVAFIDCHCAPQMHWHKAGWKNMVTAVMAIYELYLVISMGL